MSVTSQPAYSLAGKRVWVSGHTGMVGSAVVRRLQSERCELLTADRKTLDLQRQADVERWVDRERPQAVFVVAATVGGIVANSTRPAEFIYDNLVIETNVIGAARRVGVEKLLFVASSCIYPRLSPQPMPEDVLLTGPLEPTNDMYAVAKIAGIMMCRAFRQQYGCDFISAVPSNLYGPGDHFEVESSHVVPGLIAKAHAAKVSGGGELVIWGTGAPRRELMYVDDLADALVFLMQRYSDELHINVGVGDDVSIRDLAEQVASTVGMQGKLRYDATRPDGMPRKLVDASRLLAMGWKPQVSLEEGLRRTYDWYLKNVVRP